MIWKTTNALGQEVMWYSEDEVKHLNDLLNQALKELEKTRETLTEIKNKLTVHKTLYYESKLIEKLHKEILQKISECEGNDE